ncbi:DoxX family protein [Streptomyces armeniacus]|uniref:DoxX family protein n=1 Tax=Streptomyces armeniacus TaxID=83291 RepID=A0A345XNU5_9ACTN|nr:DoxX family protein [Streptomyces armeniacus]AXK33311.1 DoxX family protein [Streptomyces armeniacus]
MRQGPGTAVTGLDSDQSKAFTLGLFRIVVGLLFACHGAATLFDVLGGPHGGVPGFAEWPGWWAAAIQLAGGTLVLVGLGTRPAAVVSSGSMAYAYFVEHQSEALFPIENGGEPAAMFCWGFLLIAALGPGSLALDSLLGRSRSSRSPVRDEDPSAPGTDSESYTRSAAGG